MRRIATNVVNSSIVRLTEQNRRSAALNQITCNYFRPWPPFGAWTTNIVLVVDCILLSFLLSSYIIRCLLFVVIAAVIIVVVDVVVVIVVVVIFVVVIFVALVAVSCYYHHRHVATLVWSSYLLHRLLHPSGRCG